MVTAIRNTSGGFSVTETKDNDLLTEHAIELITRLHRSLSNRRRDLLDQRMVRRAELSAGQIGTLDATRHIREAEWTVQPLPADLLERRVELLGGAAPHELIEGLNSGAKTYIADLWNFTTLEEDELLQAHKNLNLAVRQELEYMNDEGMVRRVSPSTNARLCIAPRLMEMLTSSITVDDEPVCAAIVDIALHCYHDLGELLNRQGAALLMVRGIQSHLEARWYNDLFNMLEEQFHVSRGSIRCTVMVDHIASALEMDEILFELQDHSAGMSVDPQAYALDHIGLFSDPERDVLPDRERISLSSHMLRSLSLTMIGTCHKRKAHAIGAPSFILPPDDEGNAPAGFMEMMADKEREAIDGHDGTLVVHPGLVNAAMMEFNKSMPKSHQMYYVRKDKISPADLIKIPKGEVTTDSLKALVKTVLAHGVAERLGTAWAVHQGRIHDRSSKELAVALMWQWSSCKQGVVSSTGLEVTDDLVKFLVDKERERMYGSANAETQAAAEITANELIKLVLAPDMPH